MGHRGALGKATTEPQSSYNRFGGPRVQPECQVLGTFLMVPSSDRRKGWRPPADRAMPKPFRLPYSHAAERRNSVPTATLCRPRRATTTPSCPTSSCAFASCSEQSKPRKLTRSALGCRRSRRGTPANSRRLRSRGSNQRHHVARTTRRQHFGTGK